MKTVAIPAEYRQRFGDVWSKIGGLPQSRRFNGFVRYLIVRAEVGHAVHRGIVWCNELPGPDSVPPCLIPSTRALGTADRVLAEVDHDGFAFAVDLSDASVLNRRRRKVCRGRYQLDIVLRRGSICLRKQFLPVPLSHGPSSWFWSRLGMPFYSSVAAYLRLQGLRFVPTIREVDFPSRTIYMDYIFGENLKQHLGHDGTPIFDCDLVADPELSRLSEAELELRQIRIFAEKFGHTFRDEMRQMVLEMNRRGVAPFDIKLGNIVRGERTGRLYWLDFERARLRSQPRWDEAIHEHYRLVDQGFDLMLGAANEPWASVVKSPGISAHRALSETA
jgi:hypothetical protein